MSAPENAAVQDELNSVDKETLNKYAVTMLVTGAYLGSDGGITISGGEPFMQYASDVRKEHPELFVIATCNTNGEAGYLPTKEAFAEGGYESKSSNFTPELSDILQQAVQEMLATINE